MQIAFGKKHSYHRADLVIVSIGMGLYLSAATLNQAALARGPGAPRLVLLDQLRDRLRGLDARPDRRQRLPPGRVGYLGAAALLCSLLYWLYRQPLERTEGRIEPGSPEEMELQLASADEAG